MEGRRKEKSKKLFVNDLQSAGWKQRINKRDGQSIQAVPLYKISFFDRKKGE